MDDVGIPFEDLPIDCEIRKGGMCHTARNPVILGVYRIRTGMVS